MTANEPPKPLNRFRSRRKLMVAIASVSVVILLAGLLVALSAPKNELLTEMPTQQSRLRFLGPLRQPVSAAWQRFRATWIKPPPVVFLTIPQVSNERMLVSEAGTPDLINDDGVSVWILDAAKTKIALAGQSSSIALRAASAPGISVGSFGDSHHRVQFRLSFRSRTESDLAVLVEPGIIEVPKPHTLGRPAQPPFTILTNASFKPFGARITVPKGSSVLLQGPITGSDPTNRFIGLFVPH